MQGQNLESTVFLGCGVVAQLVEHHNGIVGVISSILFGSTKFWLQLIAGAFFTFLFKSRGDVSVALERGGNGIVAGLVPNLSAHFHVDVAAVAQLMCPPNEFLVIDQTTFTRQHKARLAVLEDRVFYVNETRVRDHCLERILQFHITMGKMTVIICQLDPGTFDLFD